MQLIPLKRGIPRPYDTASAVYRIKVKDDEHPETAFGAGFIGTSNVIERGGRRFTVRPEKIRLLSEDAAEGEAGTIRAAVYLGPVTRFIVALDGGGELAVVQQNLETSSRDVHEMEGKRVRLAWRPDVEFVIKEGR